MREIHSLSEIKSKQPWLKAMIFTQFGEASVVIFYSFRTDMYNIKIVLDIHNLQRKHLFGCQSKNITSVEI